MSTHVPLAERMRPENINEFIGQSHLLGHQKPISVMLKNQQPYSIIFWGPPGVGKTTLAQIIAKESGLHFFTLSAISSGVKEVREIIDAAKKLGKALLFIDEIHRFNKNQQDSLLQAIEKGIIILIGATTENPSFEVNKALLSRCQVYVLKSFDEQELTAIIHAAFKKDKWLHAAIKSIQETEALVHYSGGDARKLFNLLEMLALTNEEDKEITNEKVVRILQEKTAAYDKSGEAHYDIISAFIKSIRGSDPHAAVYYLARMIKGGEDPVFIARRMLILAAEDIGIANPNALLLANTCFDAVQKIGFPECRIILSQTAIYLAVAPKSNSAYTAIDAALALVEKTGDLPVPLHLRNAPTGLMKDLGYGAQYKYAHHYKNNFVPQQFLPDKIKNTLLYEPSENQKEIEIKKWLNKIWEGYYAI